MTDYTPGPWLPPVASAAKYGFPRWDITVQDGDTLVSIATVLPVGSKADRQAHAELIASAPRIKQERDELLESLTFFVNLKTGPVEIEQAFPEEFAKARKLIIKVEK